jgi:methionyl-tRNA formyltransferase
VSKFKPLLRVLFAGTPEFAIPPLKSLLSADCEIVAVLTQPDRPAGRGKKLRASPVKSVALENGLKVLQPESLRGVDWQDELAALKPDLMVVVAYGLMIPAVLLSLPTLGCWNIHASLLPRWRGAAPIQRAIEAGDTQTGVCIMQMESSLDTGPVYHCISTEISAIDTSASLHDRLAEMGADALLYCVKLALAGELPQAVEQDDSLTIYAEKLTKAEASLDWNLPAEVLQRKVRAYNPWPVAWCEFGNQRLRIWQAEVVDPQEVSKPAKIVSDGKTLIIGTAEKSLKILEIQRAGGQRMPVEQFLLAHNPNTW